jgi:ABC-type lipoprotein release transport system permease subunit
MRLIPFLVLLAAPLRQFPGRTAIAVIAIALGVALGLAVQLVNSAAADEFGQAARRLSGAADLVIRGPQAGFDESLFARIAQMPEVDVASPVVEVEAPVVGGEETLRIAGIDVFRAARTPCSWVAPSSRVWGSRRAAVCGCATDWTVSNCESPASSLPIRLRSTRP